MQSIFDNIKNYFQFYVTKLLKYCIIIKVDFNLINKFATFIIIL